MGRGSSQSLSALFGREHPFRAGDIAEHAVDVPEGGGGNIAQGVGGEECLVTGDHDIREGVEPGKDIILDDASR